MLAKDDRWLRTQLEHVRCRQHGQHPAPLGVPCGSPSFLVMMAAATGCSDPQCPPDFIETEGRCKRCPEGSFVRLNQCFSLDDGGASSSPPEGEISADAGETSNGGIADAWVAMLPDSTVASLDAGIGNTGERDGGGLTMDATPFSDPCQGIPQCVACTADSQCPEPGACLVKHCDVAKSICEPAAALAETACGASKCDGAGQCVGCLQDADCGDPGECKIKYCNPTTNICEPKILNEGDACTLMLGGAGVCGESGKCMQCNTPSDCTNAANSCQERQCNGGVCGVKAKTGNRCSTGYCNNLAQCVECATSGTCPNARPYCVDGTCTECTIDGDCGSSTRRCLNNACVNRCGDGTIDRNVGEDCEVGVDGWTNSNCLFCKQTVYIPEGASCSAPPNNDNLNVFEPLDCPNIPTFTETCLYIIGLGCHLSCNTTSNCPSGYVCTAISALQPFNPPFAGVCK